MGMWLNVDTTEGKRKIMKFCRIYKIGGKYLLHIKVHCSHRFTRVKWNKLHCESRPYLLLVMLYHGLVLLGPLLINGKKLSETERAVICKSCNGASNEYEFEYRNWLTSLFCRFRIAICAFIVLSVSVAEISDWNKWKKKKRGTIQTLYNPSISSLMSVWAITLL